ncbi:hypothetical protein [Streptomyces sp. NPDC060194]|uniref:hypothetical protein n=1 Tax=Streptomyces sp. NPDC060194 TaxID=3347069 RepID=UPI00365B1E9B
MGDTEREQGFLDGLRAANQVLPGEEAVSGSAARAASALDGQLAALRAEVAEQDAQLAFLDRLHAAAPELARIERLHPDATSVADLFDRAGVTPESVGLLPDDLPRVEAHLRELRQ